MSNIDFRTTPTQILFDSVVTALAAQGGPSQRMVKTAIDGKSTPSCAYRTDSGRKCAFGHMMPDDFYTPEMEGWAARKVIRTIANIKSFDDTRLDFISAMQSAHDSNMNSPKNEGEALDEGASWRDVIKLQTQLVRVGKRHNLDTSIVTEVNWV